LPRAASSRSCCTRLRSRPVCSMRVPAPSWQRS
jgi:hypothetical protein